ncbi:MAG: hypothetical protein GXP63_05405 [DPANN group archaeon]|nr:hypothetical protein [DPANN group archaeon]
MDTRKYFVIYMHYPAAKRSRERLTLQRDARYLPYSIIVLLSVGNADSDGTDGHASGRKAEGLIISRRERKI